MTPCYAIAAVARNGVIGHKGTMPWKIPEDMRYFRATTIGHPVIMGRKTWESLGCKPLKDRPSIVLTGRTTTSPSSHYPCVSVQEALHLCQKRYAAVPFIIGGASIYDAALPVVTRLYLTEIDEDYPGDTYFPKYREHLFVETSRRVEGNLTFRVLDRKSPAPPT